MGGDPNGIVFLGVLGVSAVNQDSVEIEIADRLASVR